MDSPLIFNRLSYKIFTMDTLDIMQNHTFNHHFFLFVRTNLNENQGHAKSKS